MGAFPYGRLCRKCKHAWSGWWFSFNIDTVLKGAHDKKYCPKCGSDDTCDYNEGKGELDWNK